MNPLRRQLPIMKVAKSDSTRKATSLTYKSFNAQANAVGDAGTGQIEAVCNTLGVVDRQSDVMEFGCWSDVISKMRTGAMKWPTLLWGHQWETPVGVVDYAEERGDGLYIKGRFNLNTTRGKDAYEDVKFGSIRELSVGFAPADDGFRYDNKGVKHISHVAEWPEVSFVLMGASPDTRVMSVKDAALAMGASEWTPDQLAWWRDIYGGAMPQPVVETEIVPEPEIDLAMVEYFRNAVMTELTAAQSDPTEQWERPWFMTNDAWKDYLERRDGSLTPPGESRASSGEPRE
jgi:HK97 family phage prohead protease